MRSLWNIIRVLAALAALAVAPVTIWWGFHTEHFARSWFLFGMPFLGVVLLALWWLLFGFGPFGRRVRQFGWFLAALILLGVLGKLLFRYDGSVGGSSLPRFVWRWQTGPAAESAALSAKETQAGPKPLADPNAQGVADFPHFFGPNRDATWTERDLSASFDWSGEKRPEILWRRPVGLGWSGFAVSGRRAITQEQRGGQEMVTCYDLLTGDLLWSHRDDASFYAAAEIGGKEMAGDGPRSVPSIHGRQVYAFGSTGILNCLRLETGEAVWQRDVLDETGGKLLRWGKSTSPLIVADLGIVVVTGGEQPGVTLIAYELEAGSVIWETPGRGASYSSPRLVTLAGARQIVSVNALDVTGHDPATGEEWWRFPWPGIEPKVGQPIVLPDDRLLVTASYGAGSHLLQIKNEGGKWSAESVWRSLRLKTKFSSATVLDGNAYLLDEGQLACVDLADGSRRWKTSVDYGFGQHLQVGDRLLVQAEPGFLAIVAAKPDGFEELSRLDALKSMTWNPPTLAGLYLLVRNDREAICFKLPAK